MPPLFLKILEIDVSQHLPWALTTWLCAAVGTGLLLASRRLFCHAVARQLDRLGIEFFENVSAEPGNGKTPIPFVALCHDAVVAIEVLDPVDEISGHPDAIAWSTRRGNRTGNIANPLRRCGKGADVLSRSLGIPVTPLLYAAGSPILDDRLRHFVAENTSFHRFLTAACAQDGHVQPNHRRFLVLNSARRSSTSRRLLPALMGGAGICLALFSAILAIFFHPQF